ncbi:MAG TPA: CatB-related O-acetyltransferase [Candidatus Binatia bacterium]|nr:CatB-related O-acetyltransferase [Candidatus Binatia bacterium]
MILGRILATAGALPALLADPRLAALVDSLTARPTRLTLALADRTGDPRGTLLGWAGRRNPAAALEVRVVDSATALAALADHDALLAGEPVDRALVVAGWQRGLCVVNTVGQAAEVGGFEDEDLAPPDAGRWYSMMEGAPVVITHPERIALAHGARINPRAVIHNEGEIRIGRGSLLGADAELNLYTAAFTLGAFCHTSSYLAAIGSRHTVHHPSTFAVSRGPYAFLGEAADEVGDIVIGNDVWIGARVVVLPGVHVADGCVVGAGSVVTSSLAEPYGIYAGNPARRLRHRFPPHVVKWLLALQWWAWPSRRLAECRAFFTTDIADKSEDELWRLVEP